MRMLPELLATAKRWMLTLTSMTWYVSTVTVGQGPQGNLSSGAEPVLQPDTRLQHSLNQVNFSIGGHTHSDSHTAAPANLPASWHGRSVLMAAPCPTSSAPDHSVIRGVRHQGNAGATTAMVPAPAVERSFNAHTPPAEHADSQHAPGSSSQALTTAVSPTAVTQGVHQQSHTEMMDPNNIQTQTQQPGAAQVPSQQRPARLQGRWVGTD